MTISVDAGDSVVTVTDREPGEDPGEWVETGSHDELERDQLWRRLASAQSGAVGGTVTTDPAKAFTLPVADYGWISFEHRAPAPTTLRWVLVYPTTDSNETELWLWEPERESAGLRVRGTADDFRSAENRYATNDRLVIWWGFPQESEPAETAEESEPRLAGAQSQESSMVLSDWDEDRAMPIDDEEPADGVQPGDNSK
jgi:hypothetical protein